VELSYRINYHYFINQKNEPDSTLTHTDILVSTQGHERQPGYYLWSYEEDWEVHALLGNPYYVRVYDEQTGKMKDSLAPNFDYFCWNKANSRVLLLGSTDKLIENTIREHKLFSVYSPDDRVSYLYRVRVKQNTIHKEAYDYFNNQKKNAEQTGSIFGVIPSELMGNIRCTSNPGILVIGYVDVSTTSTNELYLTREECFDSSYENNRRRWCFPPEEEVNESCYYCTYRGGTKNKPEDWPNDHIY